MSSWVRKGFDGIGLTQSPPGPHLTALQARYGGTVLLCIDVSGSMSGDPLRQAVSGGNEFLTEAAAAYYRCGLILWSDDVDHHEPPDRPHDAVVAALREARIGGGTDLVPSLLLCKEILGPLSGDRVVCVFSDGMIGRFDEAREIARELCAMGVRIIVRGLGSAAARRLAALACPGREDDRQVVVDVKDIGAGIASMAGLTIKGGRRRRG